MTKYLLLIVVVFACFIPTHAQTMRTIIYDGMPTQVALAPEPSTDLWITTNDLKRATRFVIKPQGVCRDELCFPLPKNRKVEFIAKKDSDTWFNLTEFAKLIKQPFTSDQKNGVWYFGARSRSRTAISLRSKPLTSRFLI